MNTFLGWAFNFGGLAMGDSIEMVWLTGVLPSDAAASALAGSLGVPLAGWQTIEEHGPTFLTALQQILLPTAPAPAEKCTQRERFTCRNSESCDKSGASVSCGACLAGFARAEPDGACEDVDECAAGSQCDANADCVNLPGSFECRCRTGWTGSGMECADVDECHTSLRYPSACGTEFDCVNTPGSFHCICADGFEEVPDFEGIVAAIAEPVECSSGRCYFRPEGEALAFAAAEERCRDPELGGGSLAAWDSFNQRSAVRSQRSEDDLTLWVGLTDAEQEGVWRWTDGTVADGFVLVWSLRQPDNHGLNEHCAQLGSGNALNDLPCDTELGFVCMVRRCRRVTAGRITTASPWADSPLTAFQECLERRSWSELGKVFRDAGDDPGMVTGGLGQLMVESKFESWACFRSHPCLHRVPNTTVENDWMCFVYDEALQYFTPWGAESRIHLVGSHPVRRRRNQTDGGAQRRQGHSRAEGIASVTVKEERQVGAAGDLEPISGSTVAACMVVGAVVGGVLFAVGAGFASIERKTGARGRRSADHQELEGRRAAEARGGAGGREEETHLPARCARAEEVAIGEEQGMLPVVARVQLLEETLLGSVREGGVAGRLSELEKMLGLTQSHTAS